MKERLKGIVGYDTAHLKGALKIFSAAYIAAAFLAVLIIGLFRISGAISALLNIFERLSRLFTGEVTLAVVINLFIKELKKTGYFYLSDVSEKERISIRLFEAFVFPAVICLICLLTSGIITQYAYSRFPSEVEAAGVRNFCFCVYGKNLLYLLLPISTGLISAAMFSALEIVCAFYKSCRFSPVINIVLGVVVSAAIVAAVYVGLYSALYILNFSAFGNGLDNLYPNTSLEFLFANGKQIENGELIYPSYPFRPSSLLFYNLQNPVYSLFIAFFILISFMVSVALSNGRKGIKTKKIYVILPLVLCAVFAAFGALQASLLSGGVGNNEVKAECRIFEEKELYEGEKYDFYEYIKPYLKYNAKFSAVIFRCDGEGEERYIHFDKNGLNYVSGYSFFAVEEGDYKVKIFMSKDGFFGSEKVNGYILECNFSVVKRSFIPEGNDEN